MSAYSKKSPPVTEFVVNAEPLPIIRGYLPPNWYVAEINVAVKRGVNVIVNSAEIAEPGAECWFALIITHPGNGTGRWNDDAIATNGEDFYLGWRSDSQGKSPLVLNVLAAMKIRETIEAFASNLTNPPGC